MGREARVVPGSGTAPALGDRVSCFGLNLARLPKDDSREGLQQARECQGR